MAIEKPAGNWIVPTSALLVATFSAVTAHLIVAGLLPQVAGELAVDIPTAGILISGYALGLAILSPVLGLLTGGVSRKGLLVAVMVVFVLSNVLSAVSSGYWMLLGARIVTPPAMGSFLASPWSWPCGWRPRAGRRVLFRWSWRAARLPRSPACRLELPSATPLAGAPRFG